MVRSAYDPLFNETFEALMSDAPSFKDSGASECLPRLVSFLVLLLALVSPCAAQNEEEEVIDFSIANEGSVNSLEEVVSGVLLIYGEIDTDLLTTGDIDIVVKETLGKVCKNFERTTGAPTLTKMFVDVRTVGQVRLGLNYSWQILPPVEAPSSVASIDWPWWVSAPRSRPSTGTQHRPSGSCSQANWRCTHRLGC
ncbi:unnamed protein product [Durusdinium trenchii]|uniref:Uncharacterized protein n=1 Tax=Durusdinium trenchii TaxID=1381693 RepID=A0ABP0ILC4_9DINO